MSRARENRHRKAHARKRLARWRRGRWIRARWRAVDVILDLIARVRAAEAIRDRLDAMIDEAPLLDPGEPWSLAQVVAALRDARNPAAPAPITPA